MVTANAAIAWGPQRRVFGHDLSSGRSILLSHSRGLFSDVIFIDPLGRYILLVAQESLMGPPNVRRVDLATGASAEVQRRMGGVWNWFADSNGVVRVGVDYDNDSARIHYRATADAPLRHVDTRHDLRDGSVVDTVHFVTDTDRGIIVTNAATGRFGVYDYDFAADMRGAAIFEHPEVDVTAAIFGPDGGVDGVSFEDERPRVHWIDPEMARLQQTIDRTFPGKTNTIVNRSRDGNRVLIYSSAADDPGTYYVFDRSARRMEIFASPYDRLQRHSFAPVRPISYRSRDGLTIRGCLTLPPGRAGQGLPLIVLPHGGP